MKEKLKRTELWMALIGAILPILNKELNLNVPTEQVLVAMGLFFGYIASRWHVKVKTANKK